MQTIKLQIPVKKIPPLATAAILAGDDLGSWIVESFAAHTAATIPGEEVHPDGSLRLDSLTGSEPEPAAPAADFFADLD